MRLRAEQLATNLNKQGLAPLYCISGDEPLQMLESADLIRDYARAHQFDERSVLNVEKGFDWNQLRQVSANLSLFSSRRLIELRLTGQKPGKEGGAALIDYATSPEPDNVLLITISKLDKRAQQTRWYKALENAGTMIQIWPVEIANLPGWVIQRTKQLGKTISRDAASLIAERVEGNLLAARQDLEKLCLLSDKSEIDVTDVMDAVSDSARFDIFALIEACLCGNIERSCRMLRGFKSEGIEPLSIFGALMWELRRICCMAYEIDSGLSKDKVFAEYRIWQQRKSAMNAVLNRHNKIQFSELLRTAVIVDKATKGANSGNTWELLENFILRIAGVKVQSLQGLRTSS